MAFNQVPQCVRKADLSELQIACQHLDFWKSKNESRCTLAMLTFQESITSQVGSAESLTL
jgi:hypothetical protein